MNRPTIALCMIMKDELSHIKDLLASVSGCFDQIIFTDTGSTDGSKEYAKSQEATLLADCPVYVKEFTWIDDFAAARNYSMEGVKTDYVMWMDLDDVLSDKEAFKMWRDDVMMLNDFWLAPYHYASDEQGKPVCTFLRERVIKTSKKFKWQYFIHEGMMAEEPVKAQLATNWSIVHKRTKEDYEKDFTRNVSMLEKKSKESELPPRLQWYYGKELHDKGRFAEAYVWLDRVVDNEKLELHDRILCFEYLVRSCLNRFFKEEAHKPQHERDLRLILKGHQLAMQGMVLAPTRAEFFCLAGDCLVQQGKELEAMPMYLAATGCSKSQSNANGFIFINHAAYDHVPRNALAIIKFRQGNLSGAIEQAEECYRMFQSTETNKMLTEFLNLKSKMDSTVKNEKVETDDIVFSCVPNSHPYPFDEEIYETKGIGGSETALVEVAKYMRAITGRRVIVFNTRESAKVESSGVEYRPAQEAYEYFAKFTPDLHIAWRHNVKLTDAKTYLWCHDLVTPGAEASQYYDKIICLSEFHKKYVQIMQSLPVNKIHVSRNGVNKTRFVNKVEKNPNKIIFSSSPDRGLDRTIKIVEKARAKLGRDLELHIFYGFENLYKYGQAALADSLKETIKTRPWIRYHGNVDQKTLAKHMMESVAWVYPADFIETYCITAIEAVFSKCYPIVREIGALKDTLRPFKEKNQADVLFLDATTDEEVGAWANRLAYAIEEEKWKRLPDLDTLDYSWKGVAEDFLNLADMNEVKLQKGMSAEATI